MPNDLYMVVVYSMHGELGYTFPEYAKEMRNDFSVDCSPLSEHWIRVVGTQVNLRRYIEETTDLDVTQADQLLDRYY